jgi:SAM-dependent methyltransferase
MGHHGVGLDTSRYAARLLKENLPESRTSIDLIVGNIQQITFIEKFDLVFAFEVLEHIDDDNMVIDKIASLLRTGGQFIFSVPAHAKLWTKHDEMVGHFRRYERRALVAKLKSNGFRVRVIWCYGFPFGNLLLPLRSLAASWMPKMTTQERTEISGTFRPLEDRFRRILVIAFKVLLPLQLRIQEHFLETDIGNGYVVVAEKSTLRSAN